MRQKTGFMTREGALALIQLGEMYRGGQIALPPEIIAKKKELRRRYKMQNSSWCDYVSSMKVW